MRIRQILAAVGLVLLALYCSFGLLFTGFGKKLDAGSVALFWIAVLGGFSGAWMIFSRRPIGRVIGIAVYAIGAIYFLGATVVSSLPAADRLFLVAIAVANSIGILALCNPRHESGR